MLTSNKFLFGVVIAGLFACVLFFAIGSMWENPPDAWDPHIAVRSYPSMGIKVGEKFYNNRHVVQQRAPEWVWNLAVQPPPPDTPTPSSTPDAKATGAAAATATRAKVEGDLMQKAAATPPPPTPTAMPTPVDPLRVQLYGGQQCVVGNECSPTYFVDGGKEPYKYVWSSGGITSTMKYAKFTPKSMGEMQVQLTISDSSNPIQTVTVNTTVIVLPNKPMVDITVKKEYTPEQATRLLILIAAFGGTFLLVGLLIAYLILGKGGTKQLGEMSKKQSEHMENHHGLWALILIGGLLAACIIGFVLTAVFFG